MKICIATGIYPPSIGGPATYSKLLFDELPKHGIDVEVLSFDEVRHLPKVISHFTYFFKLIKRSKGCSIIFAQDPVSVGFPAILVSKILRKKFFIRIAGDYAWEQGVNRFGVKDTIDDFQNKKYSSKVETLKSVQSYVASNADQVITPSKYFKNLVSGWGVKEENITHIYNGVEKHSETYDKNTVRKELKIDENKTVIVTSGRLLPWKGFAELISAFDKLSHETENVELYILGSGPLEKELKDLVYEKGLEKKVFLPGKVDRDTMFKYLNAADVFALNTSFESFSFAIVEAMQVGLPILSTNIGNIPEIVEEGKQGFLVTPNDKSQIKAKLQDLVNDSELRKTLGESARERAKIFSIENMIENLKQVLK